MTTPIRLTTQRLHLRQWCDEDLDAFRQLNNDPEVMKYLGGPMPTLKVVRWPVAFVVTLPPEGGASGH